MSHYYDRDGQPLTLEQWATKYGDDDYRQVERTDIDGLGVTVSTVWLGLDHNWGDGPPHIFETMIFGGERDEDQWRYSTEAEARASHAELVAAVAAGSIG